MRKSTFLLAGLIGFSSWALVKEPDRIELPANFDAWNLNFKLPLEKLATPENVVQSAKSQAKPGMMKALRKEGAAKEYFVAAQTYFKGYTFSFENGDVISYPMGIMVDGDKVTISGLFNLAAQSTDWSVNEDYDVVGIYDKDSGTLTIPTSDDFSNATIVGTTYNGYYQEMLIAGNVDEEGYIDTVDELVFEVIGDFEALSTETSFGVMNCSDQGVMYGVGNLYRRFYATIPQNEPKLITFSETIDMGSSYVGMTAKSVFPVVNVSNSEVTYFIGVEPEEGVFKADEEIGTIPPLSVKDISISFSPLSAGTYNTLATMEYEGEDTDPEPIVVGYEATAVDMPDFSQIVKNGEFTFETDIDFPFILCDLEDGTRAAHSETYGKRGSSTLNVMFEVDNGNIATVSWKGFAVNSIYNSAVGYFIDDNPEADLLVLDNGRIDGTHEFGPGKHSIRFQFESYVMYLEPEYGAYVYDLEFVQAPAEKEAVAVDNGDLHLENQLIRDDNAVWTSGSLIVRNRGTNPLSIESVTLSDPTYFTVDFSKEEATLFETLPIDINFSASEPGKYTSDVEIVTTSGTVNAKVSVTVRKMADFSKVVTEGVEYVTGFDTSSTDPFDVNEDGVAYNANSGEPDNQSVTSWFEIYYSIPEGATGSISWDGNVIGAISGYDDPFMRDYGIIHVYTSGVGLFTVFTIDFGEDASSGIFQDSMATALDFVGPCDNSVRFEYIKNGDGMVSDDDIMEISDFRIKVDNSGIEAAQTEGAPIVREVYNLNGIRIQKELKGINIVKEIYPDGSVKTSKIVVK